MNFRRIQKFGLNVIEGDLNLEGVPIQNVNEALITDVSLPLPSLNDNLSKNESNFFLFKFEFF